MAFNEAIARRGLNSPYDDLIAVTTNGDFALTALTKAIIAVESNWNPNAQNPRDPSAGLMQILAGAGGPAPGVSLEELLIPQVNVPIGVNFLKGLLRRYPDVDDAIASYNAGSPRRQADGQYVNQRYVDDVNTYYVWYLNNLSGDVVDPDPAMQENPGGALEDIFALDEVLVQATPALGLGALAAIGIGVYLLARR